jgi:MFS family permease
MAVDLYTLNLVLLLILCASLFLIQHHHRSRSKTSETSTPSTTTTTSSHSNNPRKEQDGPNNPKEQPKQQHRYKYRYNATPFLTAYALAAASDWLQGAYLYALYRDEHRVKPAVIPWLFATGFVASAVSGAFIGSWADRYGRKRACLGFCAVYALSCFFTTTTTSIAPWFGGVGLAGLVLGRVLGGVGTGLLFCAFDSWFVGDLRVQVQSLSAGMARGGKGERVDGGAGGAGEGLRDGEEEEMGRVFGMMSSLNSLVAIVCGVASEAIVGLTGTRKAPFWAAIGVLGLAAVVIAASWVSFRIPGLLRCLVEKGDG